MRATELLRQDHEHVHALLDRLERASGDERQALLDEIADELEVHAQIEEEIFYPAVEGVSGRIEDARAGHDHARSLLGDVEGKSPESQEFVQKAQALKQSVLAHVAEEEGAIFMEAGRLGAEELERLGQRLEERKQTLKTSLLQKGVRSIKQAARKVA